MKPNFQLRAEARENLGGNIFANVWLMAFVVVLIYSAILGIVSNIPVAPILISGAFAFGLALVFLKLARGEDRVNIEDLFKGFSEGFAQNLLLGLMISIFTTLWTLLFIIPGIVKSYAYSMAFFIRNDHPDYDWSTCIAESQKLMQGKKMKLFLLDLSFIGWYLLGFLAFGIGVVWASAYAQAARAAFYCDLVGDVAPESVETPEMTSSSDEYI